MSLFSFLNGRNYGVYNRSVAKLIGLKTTVFLSEILDKYEYHLRKNELVPLKDEEGLWFYVTVDDMEERTTLGEKEQRSCIDHLVRLGFIKKVVASQPAKRYFQVQEQPIHEFMILQINSTSSSQKAELVPPKGQTRTSQREELEPPKGRNSHIYKEPNEEPKIVIEAVPPPPPPDENFFKDKFDNRVLITKKNYDRLLEKFKDPDLIERYVEKLHRWSYSNPKDYKKKTRHDMTIEDWIERDGYKFIPSSKALDSKEEVPAPYVYIPTEEQKRKDEDRKLASTIDQKFTELFRDYTIEGIQNGLMFNLGERGGKVKVYFGDHGFRETCLNLLRKLNKNVGDL